MLGIEHVEGRAPQRPWRDDDLAASLEMLAVTAEALTPVPPGLVLATFAEEFAGWQRAIDRSGMPGLRVTRIQHYRDLYERQQKY